MFIAVGSIPFIITMYILYLLTNSKIKYTQEMKEDDLKILLVIGLFLIPVGFYIKYDENKKKEYNKKQFAQSFEKEFRGKPKDDYGVAYWKQYYKNKN
jgi:hypothetical protein